MRTMITTLAVLAFVPATAFADDQPAPRADSTAPSTSIQRGNAPDADGQPKDGESSSTADKQPTADGPRANPPRIDGAPADGYVIPQSAPYQGGKIPPGAFIEKRPNLALIGTGLGISGVAYVASVITSIAACPPQSTCSATQGAGWLYLPLVGPFVTAAMATSPGGAALAAFDGGLQVLGATLAVAGLVAPKKFVVWQDKTASLKVTPMAAAAPAMGEAKPGMTAGLSLTLTHL